MEEEDSAEEIEFLDGIESVRRRAPMYLGRLDAPELTTRLLMQALCHAIDSAIDGRCTEIVIEVSETVARVTYDAALPLERTPAGSTAAEVMLTALHACSSMKKHVRIGDRYCSLGMAVLTVVSQEMVAEIVEGERACTIELARGHLRSPVAITRHGAPTGDLTRLSFRLDEELLHDNVKFDATRIEAVCREVQDDVGGVRIEVRAVGEMVVGGA